jgi:preprotein translocase subunit SecD
MKGRRGLIVSVVATTVVCFGTLIGAVLAGLSPQLGLDLQGGAQVVYRPAHPVPTDTLDQAISIIRNRVDALGVADPNIGQQGSNIVVQLPGLKNPQQALAIIGQTAQLRFRPVLCLAPPYSGPKNKAATGPPPPCSSQASASSNGQAPVDNSLASVPDTPRHLDVASSNVLLPQKDSNGNVTVRYLLGPSTLDGSALKTASAGLDSTGQWLVNFNLTSAGSPKWDALAQANFHKQVAIVLDGVVESAPSIQPNQQSFTSFAGQGQISGNFTESSAKSLALVLKFGALPVQLQQQTVQTVSPTLGKSSLRAGLAAGLLGLLLVLLYMVFYYRGLGLVVLAGLITTGAMLWGLIAILGETSGLALDLAGATGIIVSVGVTVDSYIVYFERLKDEVRSGRTIRTSVDRGFARAYRTILAADAVSFIGALLLYLLSVGPVRGFAFFLGLSTLLDVFTAYFFTRPLVILLGRSRTFTEARWLGVAPGLAAQTETKEKEVLEPVGAGSRS